MRNFSTDRDLGGSVEISWNHTEFEVGINGDGNEARGLEGEGGGQGVGEPEG